MRVYTVLANLICSASTLSHFLFLPFLSFSGFGFEQYLYRFLPLVHNHVQVIWVRTHIRCVTCVCVRALWLMLHSHGVSASTFDGGRVWSVVLTQLCGIFLLEDAHCHRSCHFWTVYSRIMMTSLKQTRLLSCNMRHAFSGSRCIHTGRRRQRLTEGVSCLTIDVRPLWTKLFFAALSIINLGKN